MMSYTRLPKEDGARGCVRYRGFTSLLVRGRDDCREVALAAIAANHEVPPNMLRRPGIRAPFSVRRGLGMPVKFEPRQPNRWGGGGPGQPSNVRQTECG